MFRSAPLLLALSACGASSASPSTGPSSSNAAPASAGEVAVAEPRLAYAAVALPWARETVGGAVTSAAGLDVDDDGVALVVAGIDVEPALLTRSHEAGATWSRRSLSTGRATYGDLADGTALLLLANVRSMTQDVVAVDREGTADVVAAGCPFVSPARLIGPDVITYRCGGEGIVARREPSGWTTIATLPPVLVDGAVGDDGTIYLFDANVMEPVDAWVIREGVVTTGHIDGVDSLGDVDFCGGRLYATFELPSALGSSPTLGAWVDGAWQFETISTDVAGAGVLAFDETCHPFVAVGPDVYARTRGGWSGTNATGAALVRDLAVHAGRIFATYTDVTDSSHACLASARVETSD